MSAAIQQDALTFHCSPATLRFVVAVNPLTTESRFSRGFRRRRA